MTEDERRQAEWNRIEKASRAIIDGRNEVADVLITLEMVVANMLMAATDGHAELAVEALDLVLIDKVRRRLEVAGERIKAGETPAAARDAARDAAEATNDAAWTTARAAARKMH